MSGSSGHLVVQRVKDVGQEPDYPGKVFADAELGYAEAVQAFVEASQPLFGPKIGVAEAEKISPHAEIKQLRQEQADYASSGAIFASAANWKMRLGE